MRVGHRHVGARRRHAALLHHDVPGERLAVGLQLRGDVAEATPVLELAAPVEDQRDGQAGEGHLLDAGELSEDNPLLPRLEAWVVHEIVRRTGNKTLAAKMLGITKPTVYDRLRRYEALYGPTRGLEDEGVG